MFVLGIFATISCTKSDRNICRVSFFGLYFSQLPQNQVSAAVFSPGELSWPLFDAFGRFSAWAIVSTPTALLENLLALWVSPWLVFAFPLFSLLVALLLLISINCGAINNDILNSRQRALSHLSFPLRFVASIGVGAVGAGTGVPHFQSFSGPVMCCSYFAFTKPPPPSIPPKSTSTAALQTTTATRTRKEKTGKHQLPNVTCKT